MAESEGGEPSDITEGDPSTASKREAKRWVAVYAELLEMETRAIGSIRAAIAGMSREARLIAERTNLPDLEQDLDLFRTRLALWRERLAQLEG